MSTGAATPRSRLEPSWSAWARGRARRAGAAAALLPLLLGVIGWLTARTPWLLLVALATAAVTVPVVVGGLALMIARTRVDLLPGAVTVRTVMHRHTYAVGPDLLAATVTYPVAQGGAASSPTVHLADRSGRRRVSFPAEIFSAADRAALLSHLGATHREIRLDDGPWPPELTPVASWWRRNPGTAGAIAAAVVVALVVLGVGIAGVVVALTR